MNRTRQLPSLQMGGIQAEMDQHFRTMASQRQRMHGQQVDAWRPRLEVYERGDTLVVRAELAGIDEGSVDVVVHDRVLRIGGVRRREGGDERRTYHLMEIDYGPFAAAIHLPCAIDTDRAEATQVAGMLEITLPKVPPRPITPRIGARTPAAEPVADEE